MNEVSWRHHYLPQFYLNGFTGVNGKFKVYDVTAKRFVRDGKEFSPSSYFFEENANTLITPTQESDILETKYSEIDNLIATIFSKISSSSAKESFNLSSDDIALLQLFVGIMHWRIPANSDSLRGMIKSKPLEEFGIMLVTKGTGDPKESIEMVEKTLRENKNFMKFIKYRYPNVSYHELLNCRTPVHVMPFVDGLPAICSDNPLICLDPESFNVYKDDYIFPLNSTTVFIRGSRLKKLTLVEKYLMETLLLHQAVKYVSFTDADYLAHLEKLYDKRFKNLSELRATLFQRIFE